MEKLKMQTADMAVKNIELLGQLFPNCLTEKKNDEGKLVRAIDFDKLRQELACEVVEGTEERYQFTWPDKRAAIRLANAPTNKTLRPCREESVDFDNTENLYIEGDNLEVLKLLRENYLGKVKMIYIDPPYNTGNDFVYNDDFAMGATEFKAQSGLFDEEGHHMVDPMVQNTESNGRFHTDWLNMIYPRLKVAKDLLSDDGVILINMDENEITNLQNICSEIFGNCNDLGTIIWDKRNPKGDAKGISYQHEYIIAFAKNKDILTTKCKIQRPKKNAKLMITKAKQLFAKINSTYTLDDVNADFSVWLAKQTDLSGGERAYNKIDEKGKIYQSVSMAWPNKKKAPIEYFIPLIHPQTGKPCPVPEKGWRNPPKTMQQLIEQDMILFGVDENTQPRRKYILEENMFENIPSLLYYGGSDTDMLARMRIPFDTPKVVEICKEHINSFTDSNDIILDFFSGSATTAHAVMQLNANNGTNRKFIMVQLPENIDEKSEAYKAGYNNICEIGKERIRRAGKLIKEELDIEKIRQEIEDLKSQQSLVEPDFWTTSDNLEKMINEKEELLNKINTLDTGFRVLKLDESNMADVYYTPAETPIQQTLALDVLVNNIREGRTPEDLLFQVMPECNLPLSSKIEEREMHGKKVFVVNNGYLIACFDTDINEAVITAIAKEKPYYFVMRDSSMATDNVADNFDQIFNAYSKETIRRIL